MDSILLFIPSYRTVADARLVRERSIFDRTELEFAEAPGYSGLKRRSLWVPPSCCDLRGAKKGPVLRSGPSSSACSSGRLKTKAEGTEWWSKTWRDSRCSPP